MANELWLSNKNETLTIYVIIRKKSDITVYKPSTGTFVAWNNANVGDYDIPLTSVGGDIYAANHPSITEKITYIYSYYSQLGATPAITDTLLDTAEGDWNGTGIVAPAGTVTLSGYALTTLEEVKRELNISATTDDDYLTQLINQESLAIETELDRKIKARDYTEILRTKYGQLRIRHTPLLSVDRLAFGSGTAFDVIYSGTCLRATIQVTSTSILGKVIASNGTVTTNTINLASTTTASEIVTLIDAWSADWNATLINDCLSTELFQSKSMPCNNITVSVNYPNEEDFEAYILDDNGIVGLDSSADYDYVCATYRGGYEIIPDDINQYCIQRVVSSYRMRGKDSNIKSESITEYSYNLGNGKYDLISARKDLINKYKSWGIV